MDPHTIPHFFRQIHLVFNVSGIKHRNTGPRVKVSSERLRLGSRIYDIFTPSVGHNLLFSISKLFFYFSRIYRSILTALSFIVRMIAYIYTQKVNYKSGKSEKNKEKWAARCSLYSGWGFKRRLIGWLRSRVFWLCINGHTLYARFTHGCARLSRVVVCSILS